MTALVIGATGLLGQAVLRVFNARGRKALGVARRKADVALDITDDQALGATLTRTRPSLVVNCAAIADIDACEADPAAAWRANARAVAVLAHHARSVGAFLVHVSTDHFYVGAGRTRHGETMPVSLINEYARTKFAGEALAMTAGDALVVRTNILGFRGWERPTFAEWVFESVLRDKPMILFHDSYVSSIDVDRCATTMLDLVDRGTRGVINVASRDVFSKAELVQRVAGALGITLTNARPGSVSSLAVPRAASLGLDVGRAERILSYPLPTLDEVVQALLHQHEKVSCATTA